MMDFSKLLSRRNFFAGSSALAVSLVATRQTQARQGEHDEGFTYEVQFTEEEWRAKLSDLEYAILRGGHTEKQKTSPLWQEFRAGAYHCKGCDIKSFDAIWKWFPAGKGWAFFEQSEPNNVLFDIDGPVPEYGMSTSVQAVTEVHCRRCGSHLGHHLVLERKATHCINGTALVFKPEEAS
ncbi:MAG: peptide-methionine (R)-S-oxide reductase [Pseudomonadota bacterium]